MVFHLLGMGFGKLKEADELLEKAKNVERMSKKDFIKKWGELHIEGGHGFDSPIKVPMGDYYDQIQRGNIYSLKRWSEAFQLSKAAFINKYSEHCAYTPPKTSLIQWFTRKKYEELIKEGKASIPFKDIVDDKELIGEEWEAARKQKPEDMKKEYPRTSPMIKFLDQY